MVIRNRDTLEEIDPIIPRSKIFLNMNLLIKYRNKQVVEKQIWKGPWQLAAGNKEWICKTLKQIFEINKR